MKNKTVMVLAGSCWQIPIIKKIKSMGYKVLDINPYVDSPAFEYADEHELADILDRDTCMEIARRHNVDAVMSEECDIAVPNVAYISKQLGLCSIGEDMAALYTDKTLMRDFSLKHGFPCPEYKLCHSLDEAVEFFKNLGKKMIIKPLDSNSSRGVFTITTEDELKTHFGEALSFSKVDKAVLCERYIEGTEFTIDGIKTSKGHFSLTVSEKAHYAHNKNVAYKLFFSHDSDKYDYAALKALNDKYVETSGLPFGLTHAEYKYEDGQFYLIEIGARGGGNLMSSHIVPVMSGVDNYEYLIKRSLGEPTQEEFHIDEKLKDRCAVLLFFDTPGNGGVVQSIEGLDFLNTCQNIITYKLNFAVGDTVLPAATDSARIGFYIAYADTKDELLKLMDEIKNKFRIILK